ncbi:meprin A subunit beta-like isoform X2 [Centropristis striata]|uniref:meprin A subunit beta-like isoform X2 n=1 Tax=Centropristis striata TaxID=184440 RepID=UPI0027DED5F9|nr:meprin A subunit beta-like isoform X2 [Centropristis striata]
MALRWIILLLGLGLAANIDCKLTGDTESDAGEDKDCDMSDPNAAAEMDEVPKEDDEKTSTINSVKGDEYRWPTTIPYYLEDDLDINAKGVILKAFDQYRLKTCIDFTPWKGEENYISVCSSSVGLQRTGKQQLSIGENCDNLGTVEHEFLHALGFWHEHSRADRDDYVNIMWDRIKDGKETNFVKHNGIPSSALSYPYDYGSVMHYRKTTFKIGSDPTIVTKIPHFTDLIGQRMGFSASDLTRLNRLYKCTQFSNFVESCDFEAENICGMIQGPGNAKWEKHSSVSGGPQTDFSDMGKCKEQGHFMHFSTASAQPGERAFLESRWVNPKPGAQCLQFFLHNSGAADDVLNIWVREYDATNPSGTLKLFKSISGGVMGSWELHNINLNVTQKARVVFEGVRGNSTSKGGFSLDDINLSSTTCPQHVWRIRNITHLMATTPVGVKTYSPPFLSPSGYSFQVGIYLNGRSDHPGYMAIYFHLTSGPNDHNLEWPCVWKQATMALMDQQSDIRQQMNMHHMVTTDPDKTCSDGIELYWDDPREVGSKITASDGTYYYRGPGNGKKKFISHSGLKSRKFIKGDDAFFFLSLEDISDLLESQPLPSPSSKNAADQGAPQGGSNISL